MKWIWHKYHDLDDSQLRDISELRKSFFEADQEDPVKDEYDEMSFHLLVIPPHGEFINPYLSRIIVAEKFRKKGFGKALVNELSNKSKALFSNKITKVSSLASTLSFYKKNNFIEDKKVIDEAGVEHFILLKND
jgi:predicted GNAT family N-acyltransferase